MFNLDFFIVSKHNEGTWRGVTTSHPIPEFPVEKSYFTKNPHNYRRFYSISSYENRITVKTINAYDLYIKDALYKDKYAFYKDFEMNVASKSFDSLTDALNYLENDYNVKLVGV